MIPYFQWIQFTIGPIPIHVWGLMVALGILAGLWVATKAAKARGLDTQRVVDLAFWVIVFSMVGARLIYVLSEISLYVEAPLNALKIWEGGLSITGGFLGAVLAGWTYLRIKKLPLLEYIDVSIFGLPVGLWIGRLGCFFIYDHPGTPTSFFLGQEFVDGVIRHNLGLYLSINGLLMTLVFFLFWKINTKRPAGFFVVLFLLWYGVMRFFLDFYRATDLAVVDARFAGLTVAQYAAVLMVVGGIILWYAVHHGTGKKKETSVQKKNSKQGRE